jgi:hypothetical protein
MTEASSQLVVLPMAPELDPPPVFSIQAKDYEQIQNPGDSKTPSSGGDQYQTVQGPVGVTASTLVKSAEDTHGVNVGGGISDPTVSCSSLNEEISE